MLPSPRSAPGRGENPQSLKYYRRYTCWSVFKKASGWYQFLGDQECERVAADRVDSVCDGTAVNSVHMSTGYWVSRTPVTQRAVAHVKMPCEV
jgi:hypothetical protein